MVEDTALKPRRLPSKLSHHNAGDASGSGYLSAPQPAPSLKRPQDPDGNLLEWARHVLGHTPSVRSELVRALQIQVDVGLYHVDLEALAERLVPHVCRPLVVEVIENEG